MTPFIERALHERTLGLALHYPLLHAAVVGLNATRTLEFGAGGSTRVFLDALPADEPGQRRATALHESISTEPLRAIVAQHGLSVLIDEGGVNAFVSRRSSIGPHWIHHCGKSESYRHNHGALDLILHDGSHAANVVAEDIAWAWPFLKCYGLLLVHDTQHSYVGAEVREGMRRGLAAVGAKYSATTLPYGFGLTIVRREHGGPGEVVPAIAKASSSHRTEPQEFFP